MGGVFSARLDGQLIKHIFLSPNQLLVQLVLGEISIYLRGQQWVLILLVPPSEIRSESSPVTSETLLWSRRLQRAAEISEAVNFENLANSVNFQGPP